MAPPEARVTGECEDCRARAQGSASTLSSGIDDRNGQVNFQELADISAKYERQKKAYEETQRRLRFLKLPDTDTLGDCFRGDVTFVVHATIPRVVHAHRFILACRSSVFRRMFEVGMSEEETGRIQINDASYATMRAVVNYCYTAEISFSDEVRPEEVLKVAHKYDIPMLKGLCDEELCGRITPLNLPEMLRLSRTYEARKLHKDAMNYFKHNFDTVQETVMDTLFPVK